MKKLLFLIILLLTIVPCLVFAASTCNPDDIVIQDITLTKTCGNGEEVTASSVQGRSLNLDVKLYDPNDYMEYTITVKNTGTNDYYIKGEDLGDDQYLSYEFLYEEDKYIIEPGEEKEIVLRVKYKERVEGNGNYTSTDTLVLNILDKQDIKVTNTLMNLNIGLKILIALVLIAIIVGSVILFINNKNSRMMIILLIGLVLFIPKTSNAACDATIDVDVKVELDSKNATFKAGPDFNMQIKTLAGTTIGDNGPYTPNETILAFKKSNYAPAENQKNIASSADSELPIYVWFDSDDDAIYWWSEDDTPSLGTNGSFFLAGLNKVTDISGAATIDASNATTLNDLLPMAKELTDLSPLANWNTSSNTLLYDAFLGIAASDLSPLRNWDTSKVTNMGYMFEILHNLVDLNPIKDWDTSSVTDLSSIFQETAITNVDALAKWDVSHVTNFYSVFYNDIFLTDISGLTNWNTSSATNMDYTFDYCIVLDSLEPLRKWDTSKVTSMRWMFGAMESVTTLEPIEYWNVSSLINAQGTFGQMSGITSADLRGWDVSNVTIMTSIFDNCTNLVNLEGIRNWNTGSVTIMSSAFRNDDAITSLEPISRWNVSNLETAEATFSWMDGLTSFELTYWNPVKLVNAQYMFQECVNVTTLEGLRNWDVSSVQTIGYMFKNLNKVTTIEPIEGWTTSSLVVLHETFEFMSSLTSADLTHWDVSHADCVELLFHGCTSLTEVDITGWNTQNLKFLRQTFDGCENLTVIHGIEYINTSKVQYMNGTFSGCKKLQSLDLHRWDVSKVTNMNTMFFNCKAFTSLDLTGWNTEAVTDISYMFKGLNLSVIDISSFNTKKVKKFVETFNNSTSLTKIYVGENWDISANTGSVDNVFPSTCSLPNFSTSNENYRQLSWARLDTDGGYLSTKPSE